MRHADVKRTPSVVNAMPLSALGASLVRKFWALFVILLMLVAIYVSVGRMVMPHLQNYQPELEQALSEALGVQCGFCE